MERKIISKEMADTFIWDMNRKGLWVLGKEETKEMRKYLEMFGKFILDEYDVLDVLCGVFEDEIREYYAEHEDDDEDDIRAEKAEQRAINKMLDAGRA